MDFIEEVFFNEQIESIHQLKSWIAKLSKLQLLKCKYIYILTHI